MGERLTTAEAARIVGVSVRTITRWCDDGKLPYLRLESGHRRIDVDDLPSAARPMRRRKSAQGGDVPGLVHALADAVADLPAADLTDLTETELAELRAAIGNGTVGLARELQDLADDIGDELRRRDAAAVGATEDGTLGQDTRAWLDQIDDRRNLDRPAAPSGDRRNLGDPRYDR